MPETDLLPFLKSREGCVSYAVANGNTIWVRASAVDTGGAYTLIEGHHVAGTGPPLHTHDAEDETFLIVDGSYAIQADDQEFSAAAGDVVFVPRLVRHRFQCRSDGRMLLLYTPGGFEGFFAERASAESVRGRSLQPDELDAIGRGYGMRVVQQPNRVSPPVRWSSQEILHATGYSEPEALAQVIRSCAQ